MRRVLVLMGAVGVIAWGMAGTPAMAQSWGYHGWHHHYWHERMWLRHHWDWHGSHHHHHWHSWY
jgi:hypothetical protein